MTSVWRQWDAARTEPELPPTPWLGLELRHLAALEALSAAGSFRAAAERLGCVQSALSQQITKMEGIVGMRLVDRRRGRRSVALTPAGLALAGHARPVLAQLDAARADFGSLDPTPVAGLRVAVAPSVEATIRPSALAALRHHLRGQLPEPRIEWMVPIRETDLGAMVDSGEADLAIGELAGGIRDGTKLLLEDPYVMVLPATPEPRAATLEDLSGLGPLLAPHSAQGLAHGERALSSRGLAPASTAKSVGVRTVQGLVRAGIGVAILPRLSVDLRDRGVSVHSLEGQLPSRPISFHWNPRRRRIGPFVCEELRAAIDGRVDGGSGREIAALAS